MVLTECKDSAKELAVYQWNLGDVEEISTEQLWTWDKEYRLGDDGDAYLGLNKYVNFEKDIWLELVKCSWRKQRSIFHYHLKYICNDIVKLLWVEILRYAMRVQDMHDLAKCLPPPSMKGNIFESDSWGVRKK